MLVFVVLLQKSHHLSPELPLAKVLQILDSFTMLDNLPQKLHLLIAISSSLFKKEPIRAI